MPTYITLYKLTDQGIKNIKEAPGRIEEGIRRAEEMGGRVLGFYTVIGEYDYVAIAEFKNDETAMALSLAISAQGNVRTTTMKGFTKDEFAAIINKMA